MAMEVEGDRIQLYYVHVSETKFWEKTRGGGQTPRRRGKELECVKYV